MVNSVMSDVTHHPNLAINTIN